MRLLIATLLAIALAAPAAARADKKSKNESTSAASDKNKGPKVKNYDFSGLDVDGRLRTPQILYFLNRMKSEFDSTTPDKRSFLPELKRSGDDL